ncbi:MAG: hypothetical protein WDN31_18715 [Hyphomicrobium sp.]
MRGRHQRCRLIERAAEAVRRLLVALEDEDRELANVVGDLLGIARLLRGVLGVDARDAEDIQDLGSRGLGLRRGRDI